MCLCVSTTVYMYTHVKKYPLVDMYIYIHVYTSAYVCYVHIDIDIDIDVHIYVHVYVYIYVYIYTPILAYVYTYKERALHTTCLSHITHYICSITLFEVLRQNAYRDSYIAPGVSMKLPGDRRQCERHQDHPSHAIARRPFQLLMRRQCVEVTPEQSELRQLHCQKEERIQWGQMGC